MQDSLRRSFVTLPILGAAALAAAAGVATFTATRSLVLTAAQLGLTDTGTGAGNTTAVVKVNGTIVATLSLAGAAAARTVTQPAAKPAGALPYPAGVAISAGDVVTIDITAVPATTAPKGGFVLLDVTQVDV